MERRGAYREKDVAELFDAAAHESYMAAVDRAFEAQKDGVRLSRTFFQSWMETLEEGVEINRRALEDLQRIATEQREVFFDLSRQSLDAYDGFVDSLDAYEAEISDQTDPDRES